MRIRSEAPDLLVLEDRPVFIALLLSAFVLIDVAAVFGLAAQGEWAGVAMLGLGVPFLLAGFVVFVRRTIVFFDRASGLVTIRVASLIRQAEESLPLADVTGADVQRSQSSRGGSTTLPILRLRDGGTKRLLSVSTSGGGSGRAAAGINRWLAGARPA